MKLTHGLALLVFPLLLAGCGGAGGTPNAGGISDIAATYRSSFTRGTIVPNTTLVMFIDKQNHVGIQLNSATEVEYAGEGTFLANHLTVNLVAVGSTATGTVLVQGNVVAGDPPTINIVLSGAVSANVTATEFSGADVVLTAGTYNGSFEGDDTGTFSIDVANDGSVTGTVNSSQNGDNLSVEGSVDLKGEIHFGFLHQDGNGLFEGYLFPPVNSSSFKGIGDWSQNTLDGDWEASKIEPV